MSQWGYYSNEFVGVEDKLRNGNLFYLIGFAYVHPKIVSVKTCFSRNSPYVGVENI